MTRDHRSAMSVCARCACAAQRSVWGLLQVMVHVLGLRELLGCVDDAWDTNLCKNKAGGNAYMRVSRGVGLCAPAGGRHSQAVQPHVAGRE